MIDYLKPLPVTVKITDEEGNSHSITFPLYDTALQWRLYPEKDKLLKNKTLLVETVLQTVKEVLMDQMVMTVVPLEELVKRAERVLKEPLQSEEYACAPPSEDAPTAES